jgi:Uma2 family endonuclease
MRANEKPGKMTVEDYLAFEEKSDTRHEFVDGNVFAMSGASLRHNTIGLNVATEFKQRLRGTPCRAYIMDVKLRVAAANCFYYPDVMVSCEQGENPDDFYTAAAVLVVEILSRSTAHIDRREKLLAYKRLPSLVEYMIVWQTKPRVEVYRRVGHDEWDGFCYEAGSIVRLESLPGDPVEVPMSVIYEDVVFKQSGIVREPTPNYEPDGVNEGDW